MIRISPTFIIAFLVLCLVICAGLGINLIQAPSTVLTGLITYPARVLPQVHISLSALFTFTLTLVIILALTHSFARWLYPALTTRRWPLAATFSILAITFLLFFTGMAATGIAHQSTWLLTGPTWYRANPRMSQSFCEGNLDQIYYMLEDYAKEHAGRLPDSLAALKDSPRFEARFLVCPTPDDRMYRTLSEEERAEILSSTNPPIDSYIYYGRGLSLPLPPKTPLIAEPLSNHHGDGLNVLTADGKVEFLKPTQAVKFFATLAIPSPQTPSTP